jgi:Bacterial Ig-like domain (group 3)
VSGTGTISTTISTPGTHTITIVYSGDANNAASTATVTMNVTLPPEQLVPILQLLLDD